MFGPGIRRRSYWTSKIIGLWFCCWRCLLWVCFLSPENGLQSNVSHIASVSSLGSCILFSFLGFQVTDLGHHIQYRYRLSDLGFHLQGLGSWIRPVKFVSSLGSWVVPKVSGPWSQFLDMPMSAEALIVRIFSHLLKKFLAKNFVFHSV